MTSTSSDPFGNTLDAADFPSEITTRTVAVQHPAMSHCLIIDTDARRLDSALRAWAASYVARHFDVVLDYTEFTVCNTSPSAEPFDLWGRNDD